MSHKGSERRRLHRGRIATDAHLAGHNVANEGDAVPYVRDHVGTLATIYADEGSGWDALHAGWDARRVNHSVAFMDGGVVIETGPPAAVLLNPRHERTRAFLAKVL